MSDPSVPEHWTIPPGALTRTAAGAAATNAAVPTDAPGQVYQAPRSTPTSADPWTPPVIPQTNPATAQAPEGQPDGANRPTPLRTIPHPEPTPKGGPRPAPFQPAAR